MAEPSSMNDIRPIDILTFLAIIFSALANYYSMRERIKVIETKLAPITTWWDRIATNAANKMFHLAQAQAERDKELS